MANTGLASINDMAKGLQQSATQATNATISFMKYTKFGEWLYGTDEIEVDMDSLWVIHPQVFEHGWIAWGDKAHGNHGEKLGEIMVHATEPLPLKSTLDHVEGNWNQQISMQLLCLTGMDKDTRVTFNTNSTGGRRLYKKIVDAVIAQLKAKKMEVAPVVKLEKDSYPHPKFGKIFIPLMKIVEWKTLPELSEMMDALGIENKAEEKAKSEPEEKSSRQKRTRKA